MMKVGVLGGSGFLGMNIIRHLVQNPAFQVSATSRKKKPEWSLLPVQWSELELNDPKTIQNFLKDLDAVIYLAHEGGPNIVKNWQDESDQNLLPIRNFVEALRSLNRPTPMKVIYFSSGGAIYGKAPSHTPWIEESALSPVSPYGVLKQTCENILRLASLERVCDCIGLRVSNPYGNRFVHQKSQGIIDVAIAKLATDSPFSLYGSPGFVRDFIFIDDLTVAVEQCLAYETTYDVFNIGSGIGTSIGDTLTMVQKVFGKKLRVDVIPSSPKIIPIDWSVLDVTKAKKMLHWSPQKTLEQGIQLLR